MHFAKTLRIRWQSFTVKYVLSSLSETFISVTLRDVFFGLGSDPRSGTSSHAPSPLTSAP